MLIKITNNISDDRIKALLCTAFEGGVGYWCQIKDYEFTDDLTYADFCTGGKMQGREYWNPSQLIPLTPGCAVICIEYCEEDPEHLRLDREKVQAGLQLMSDKYPQHFAAFVNDDYDAYTGDVFLQLCLLGEVVYG